MKRYKSWEVIKELNENLNKKFKLDYWETSYLTNIDGMIGLSDDIGFWISKDNKEDRFDIGTYLKEENKWILIQESVDFMKAVNSGKKIVPESLREEKDYQSYTYWLGYMVSSMAHRGNPVDLINGKWFIEEE